jgi:hypothetical protein
MQSIPTGNIEELERSRREMEAFRRERAFPDITLTGEDIHSAFCRIEPDESRPWGSLNLVAIRRYEALATELNRELNARLEGEDKSISAIRCPDCGHMTSNLKGHDCL